MIILYNDIEMLATYVNNISEKCDNYKVFKEPAQWHCVFFKICKYK